MDEVALLWLVSLLVLAAFFLRDGAVAGSGREIGLDNNNVGIPLDCEVIASNDSRVLESLVVILSCAATALNATGNKKKTA